jgi:hypothetical protein
MRKISTGEQARMVNVATSSFNDLCDIYHFTGLVDSLSGQVLETYDSTLTVLGSACGFNPGPQFRNERGQIITVDADAVLRTAASVGVKDKIVIRSVTYIVDGVTPGRDVTIAALKEIKI